MRIIGLVFFSEKMGLSPIAAPFANPSFAAAPLALPLPGLLLYRPLTAEKLAPSLQAASAVGVSDVAVVDDRLRAPEVETVAARIPGPPFQRLSIFRLEEEGGLASVLGGERLWGIFAPHEAGVEPAAAFARSPSFRGIAVNPQSTHSAEAAEILRRKDAFRRFVVGRVVPETAGIQGIWHSRFSVSDLSVSRLREAGAPDKVVIKPINASGSKGVEFVDLTAPDAAKKLDSIMRVLDEVRRTVSGKEVIQAIVEVEEYVEGEEFSVEGFFDGRRPHVSVIHWKPDMHRDWRRTGQFLEGRFLSLPPDTEVYPALVAANEAVLSRIPGFGASVFHAEYRVEARTGAVFPIEVAGRPAGGSLSASSRMVSGVDLFEAGIRLAVGVAPVEPEPMRRLTSEGVIFADRNGTLHDLRVRLPGMEPFSAIELGAAQLREHLNRWLEIVPRSLAARTYDDFESAVPFPSPLRRQLREAFDAEGRGLGVTVQELNIWSEKGVPIHSFAGVYLGSLVMTSGAERVDRSTLADLTAAMGLVLNLFEPDVL